MESPADSTPRGRCVRLKFNDIALHREAIKRGCRGRTPGPAIFTDLFLDALIYFPAGRAGKQEKEKQNFNGLNRF